MRTEAGTISGRCRRLRDADLEGRVIPISGRWSRQAYQVRAAFALLVAVSVRAVAAGPRWADARGRSCAVLPGTGIDSFAHAAAEARRSLAQPWWSRTRPRRSGTLGPSSRSRRADGTRWYGATTLIINRPSTATCPTTPARTSLPWGSRERVAAAGATRSWESFPSGSGCRAKAQTGALNYRPRNRTHSPPREGALQGARVNHLAHSFSSTGPAVDALLGGEVPLMFLPVHVPSRT